MVRVLHICGSIDKSGGVGNFLMNNYRKIDKRKIQFDFLTHIKASDDIINEIESYGGTISTITPKSKNIIRNLFETHNIINKKSKNQVIHIHTASPTSFIYQLFALFAGKKVRIAHSHGTNLEKEEGSLQHKIHRITQPILRVLSTDLFACSEEAGEWLFGKTKRKIEIIKNAIDTDRFVYSETIRKSIRNSLNIENVTVIGHIGRLTYAKNHKFLLDVYKQYRNLNSNSVLILTGTGELESELVKLVKDMNLSENVKFLGFRSDIPDLLNAFDLFLFPSLLEGLPLVLVEAQSTGLRIIKSDKVPDDVIVTDLITTVSLKSSAEEWAKSMDDCLKNSIIRSSRNKELEKNGYNINGSVNNLEKFYLINSN